MKKTSAMSEALNVIALVSGGKDSFYCLLHCINNGHQVVALANLYPKAKEGPADGLTRCEETEDLNSFMYQTVGHSIIPLYAECLGLPLYRRQITGSATQTGRYYDPSRNGASADETEDLIPLLQEAKQKHPEANAVCSGAILSTYQRTRIESIAIRLGLIPLAFLWQYPALPPPPQRGESVTGLLDDMDAAQCDARIIKIASGGLNDNLLWSNVADPRSRSRIVAGMAPFFPDHEFWLRGAVLGEGGEYETLTLNGPRSVWQKRIEIREETNVTLSGEGGTSYVRPGPATLVLQESLATPRGSLVRVPKLLDFRFESVLASLQGEFSEKAMVVPGTRRDPSAGSIHPMPSTRFDLAQNHTGTHLALSNITDPCSAPRDDALGQITAVCGQVQRLLDSLSTPEDGQDHLTSSSIISTTLLLASMSDFSAINAIYSSLFRPGEPNPPARVTLGCDLPTGIKVSLNIILAHGSRDRRRGLHVQSRSYWAPANIGPYSQAICEPVNTGPLNVHDGRAEEFVHVAGQIPLLPHNMQLMQASTVEQAVLSLQHLWRVGQERAVDLWPWGMAFLKHEVGIRQKAYATAQTWYHAHLIASSITDSEAEEKEEPDAWDLQYNRFAAFRSSVVPTTNGKHLHLLPNPAVFGDPPFAKSFVPPFIAAEVTSLPRDAPVEWWSLGLANLPKAPSENPRISVRRKQWTWGTATSITVLSGLTGDDSDGVDQERDVHLITIMIDQLLTSPTPGLDIPSAQHILCEILLPPRGAHSHTPPPRYQLIHGTALVSNLDHQGWDMWSRVGGVEHLPGVALIPCSSVWGRQSYLNDDVRQTLSTIRPLALAMTLRIAVDIDP